MNFKQDMPPVGGYPAITFQRIPLKKGFNIHAKLVLSAVLMGFGIYVADLSKKKQSNERIEMRCGRFALTPMLVAETDRMLLKQLRRNRDAEERIMKDVPGWEVGKWKHMPVFLTLGPDEYFKPVANEYYAHADEVYYNVPKNVMKRR